MQKMSELNFREQLQRRLLDAPDALAIQFRDNKLSYSELGIRIEQLHTEFGDLDGRRVIILLPDSLEAYLMYLFLFLSRAVIVPLSVQVTTQRIRDIIAKVEPDLILTTELLYQTHSGSLSSTPCMVLTESGRFRAKAPNFPEPVAAGLSREFESGTAKGDEAARFIIFTSGSTGVPKGACLSEHNVISAADMMVDFLPLDARTKSVVTVPLYDYYGLIQIFGHVLGGGCYIFGLSPSFPKQFFRVLKDEGTTDLVLVPHTLGKLVRVSSALTKEGMSSLRRITSSSDVLTEDLLSETFEVNGDLTVVNIYGLTEAGRACYRKINRGTAFSNSIGRPSKGVGVRIEGSYDGLGEIVLSGPNVMLGYIKGIKANRVEFSPCHEMRTGDLGYFDQAGEIVLVGRKDHMINLMGAKIHPSEIETAALRVKGILEARARLGRTNPGQPRIELDVVLDGGSVSIEGIREELQKSLPRMFVPASICVLPELARTELGAKIIR
jgi:long-chain acyl-CoA synthetase